MSDEHGPLHGVRVIDFSVMISGPLAAMQLAEQGADVIKVESPGIGDVMRALGTRKNGMTGIFANNNRGKRSLVVDLKHPEGRDVVERLVADADVVVQNFRPGAMARLGLGPDDLLTLHPDLIYTSISGYGGSGPSSGRRVYDNVIQAASGLATVQTNPASGDPELFRTLLCDKVTAHTAAQAITAALFARATGRAGGQHLEIAMLDAAVSFMWPDGAMDASLLDDDVTRSPTIASGYNLLRLADGFASASAVTDAEFRGLCGALGRPEIADDPRFGDTASRSAHAADLRPRIAAAAAGCGIDDFARRAEELDVPAAVVTSLEDLPDDPQVLHNEILTTRHHPLAGTIREPRPPARFSATPQSMGAPAPGHGEHTEEIVRSLGLDPAALRAAGAIP